MTAVAAKRRFVEPPPAPAAPVFDTTPVFHTVQRIAGGLIDQYATWLTPLLQEDFGNPAPGTVMRWMRSWAMDNQFNFVGTPNAAGLAVANYAPLTAFPIVEEVFLYVQGGEENEGEGLEIYRHFHRWAKMSNAHRLVFNYSRGAPNGKIMREFPGLTKRQIWSLDIE